MPNPLPYLDALDITVWQRRDKPLLAEMPLPSDVATAATEVESKPIIAEIPISDASEKPSIASTPSVETVPVQTAAAEIPPLISDDAPPPMDAPPDYLNVPDIALDDRFEPLLPDDSDTYFPEPEIDPKQARAQAILQLDWAGLQAKVKDCQDCDLHQQRTQTVFGVGDAKARWLVVGEAPGQEEDLQGEPFVGRAGQLLNAMLKAVGLQREQVYIANTVKCRPPKNRNPQPLEMDTCAPYLQRQIALIEPQLILVIGRVAVQQVLHSEEAIGRLRGKVHQYADSGIPVVVSYHPAYLLRRPSEKAKVWSDLQLACRTVKPLV